MYMGGGCVGEEWRLFWGNRTAFHRLGVEKLGAQDCGLKYLKYRNLEFSNLFDFIYTVLFWELWQTIVKLHENIGQ